MVTTAPTPPVAAPARKFTRLHLLLLAIFLAAWTWAAIDPVYPDDWWLENVLVFLGVPLIVGLGFYFRLSNLSYTLITVFMVLHVIGSHYTYAEVPFGDTLQRWFDSDRNLYDRLVHFCFGLLLAYPVREVFVRITRARGFWTYYLPVELTLAFSAIYELIEWAAAAGVDPEAGLAFLGAQGDVWDGLGRRHAGHLPDRLAHRRRRPPRPAREPAHPRRRPADRRTADPGLVAAEA